MEYEIDIKKGRKVAIVEFYSNIDINNKNKVIKIIKNEILPTGIKYVIFVISDIEYIDSSGLGVLLSARSILSNEGGDLAIVNKNKKLQKILNLAGFKKMFKLYSSLEEGIKKVKL